MTSSLCNFSFGRPFQGANSSCVTFASSEHAPSDVRINPASWDCRRSRTHVMGPPTRVPPRRPSSGPTPMGGDLPPLVRPSSQLVMHLPVGMCWCQGPGADTPVSGAAASCCHAVASVQSIPAPPIGYKRVPRRESRTGTLFGDTELATGVHDPDALGRLNLNGP